jgi:hypothetical protein
MGTITCVVNADLTLTFTSISGTNPSNTWARFEEASFKIAGGGTFSLAFTPPFSDFQFDTSTPILWGTGGQPSWIQISGTPTATALTLTASSSQTDVSHTFTIQNSTTGGQPIQVTVTSAGGSGGAGGTIEVYLGDDATALIGPLPAGALATGKEVRFGFRDAGEQEIVLSPGEDVQITGLTWKPSQPDFVDPTSSNGQSFILIDNVVGNPPERRFATFTIGTNHGSVDPTIITNPDESGPLTIQRARNAA